MAAGLYIRELVQAAPATCRAFEEYVACLEASPPALRVTAVACVRAGAADGVVVADDRGYFRHILVEEASFRVFALMQIGGKMPWAGTAAECGDDDTVYAAHGAYVSALAFAEGDTSMVLALSHSACVYHTGYLDEDCLEFNVYPLGRCARAVAVLAVGGRWVAAGDDGGEVRLWPSDAKAALEELPPTHTLAALHGAPVTSMAFTCDGTRLFTGSADHAVHIVEAGSGAVLKRMMAESGRVTALSPLVSGGVLVSNDRGTNIIVDGEGGIVMLMPALSSAAHSEAATAVATSTRGGGALAAYYALGTATGTIAVLRVADGGMAHSYSLKCAVASVAFVGTRSGDLMVAVGETGAVWMWPAARFLPHAAEDAAPPPVAGNGDVSFALSEDPPEPAPRVERPAGPTSHTRHAGVSLAPSPSLQDRDELPEPWCPAVECAVPDGSDGAEGDAVLPEAVLPEDLGEVVEQVAPSASMGTGSGSREGSPRARAVVPRRPSHAVVEAGKYTAPGRAAARGLVQAPRLSITNPEKLAAIAGRKEMRGEASPAGSENGLARPKGRALAEIEGQIAEAKGAVFDAAAFAAAHPEELRRQRDLHPLADTTTYGKHAKRYTDPLPSLDVADSDLHDRRLVPKQIDAAWQHRLSVKPCIHAIPKVVQAHFTRSSHPVGGIYDCPASIRAGADDPLGFSAIDAMLSPFVPRTPHPSVF